MFIFLRQRKPVYHRVNWFNINKLQQDRYAQSIVESFF